MSGVSLPTPTPSLKSITLKKDCEHMDLGYATTYRSDEAQYSFQPRPQTDDHRRYYGIETPWFGLTSSNKTQQICPV